MFRSCVTLVLLASLLISTTSSACTCPGCNQEFSGGAGEHYIHGPYSGFTEEAVLTYTFATSGTLRICIMVASDYNAVKRGNAVVCAHELFQTSGCDAMQYNVIPNSISFYVAVECFGGPCTFYTSATTVATCNTYKALGPFQKMPAEYIAEGPYDGSMISTMITVLSVTIGHMRACYVSESHYQQFLAQQVALDCSVLPLEVPAGYCGSQVFTVPADQPALYIVFQCIATGGCEFMVRPWYTPPETVSKLSSSWNYELVDGPTQTRGRLQMRPSASFAWGTVCNGNFTEVDAVAVCHSLGFTDNPNGTFYKAGGGNGPIYMDEVGCKSSDADLWDCYYEQSDTCLHRHDVGVDCSTLPTPEPATAEPSTAEPATAEPSTAEPSTAEPSTAEPSTAEPSTAEPSTAEPSTAEPATAEPSTAEPSTAEPATADSSTAASVGASSLNASSAALSAQSTAEPSTAEPATAEPATAEPSTAEPSTEPSTAEPATAEPSTAEPATAEPSTAEPSTAEPSTAEPSTAEPSTAEPATAEPSTAEPSTAEPSTAEPATAEPATAEPATAEPSTAEPSTAEPATAKPTTEEPLTPEPSTTPQPAPLTPSPTFSVPAIVDVDLSCNASSAGVIDLLSNATGGGRVSVRDVGACDAVTGLMRVQLAVEGTAGTQQETIDQIALISRGDWNRAGVRDHTVQAAAEDVPVPPEEDDSNIGAIIGAIIGLLAVCALLGMFLFWRNKKKNEEADKGRVLLSDAMLLDTNAIHQRFLQEGDEELMAYADTQATYEDTQAKDEVPAPHAPVGRQPHDVF